MDLATSGLLGNYDNLEIDSIKFCFNFPNEPKTKPSVKGHWIIILSLADQIKYLVTLRELGLFFFLLFFVQTEIEIGIIHFMFVSAKNVAQSIHLWNN